MRPIDADALKSVLSDKDYITYTHEYGEAIPVEWVISAIDNAPTVERPQGEWIKHIRCIECSVCKNKFFADDEDENCQDYEPCTDLSFNFCPNCGADMRGKEND